MLQTIQEIIGPVLTAIGAFLVAGGGLAAVAYWLFKTFSERWLNAKFEERLAAYKHAQQRELEHLRLEINALMDRTVKLHQREFEVLPQAWSLLNDAFFEASSLMGFKEYPNLNNWSVEQLEEFLEKSDITESRKKELRAATDKTSYYMKHIAAWKEISDAQKAWNAWQSFFLKNGIFIPQDIKSDFAELSALMKGAVIEYETRQRERDLKLSECKDLTRLTKEGRKLRDALEAKVQERLWISAKSPS